MLFAFLLRRNSAKFCNRMDLFDLCQKILYILFLVENQICKLLFSVNKDQPIIDIRGRIVRLNFFIGTESPINVIIRTVILYAEIVVIQTFFAEPDTAGLFRDAVIRIVQFIADFWKGLVRSFEFQYTVGEKFLDYLQCFPPFGFRPRPVPGGSRFSS